MGSELPDDKALKALYGRIIELHATREYATAVPLAERYAEAMKQRHGVDHPQYGAALTNLALQMMAANRLTEAEPVMRRGLTILEKSPGAKQSEIARALTNLAELLIRTNRSDEALPLLRRVLTILEQRSHEGSQGVLRELAQLIDADRLAEAVPLMRRLVAIVITEPLAGVVHLASFAAAPRDPVLSQELEARRRHHEEKGERELRARIAELDAALAAIISNDPVPAPQRALEIEAGRLAYQIPNSMWRGVRERVEVRLGRLDASKFTLGFAGRGDIGTENVDVVETMSVSLMCEPGTFDIEPRSKEAQLVKPDLVKGTAFHQADFAKWVWLVTPRQSGEHTLLVKISAALRDSRGLPTTSSLPDKIIAVTVRVDFVRATAGAVRRTVPALAWTVATTLVGIFTHDYWWPYVRDTVWPAVRAVAGMP